MPTWSAAKIIHLAPANGGKARLVTPPWWNYNGSLTEVSPLAKTAKTDSWRTMGCRRRCGHLQVIARDGTGKPTPLRGAIRDAG